MKKINSENAREKINEKLVRFETAEKFGMQIYVMTENEFDELVKEIMNESTKSFSDGLAKQTKKFKYCGHNEQMARISTYKYDYAFIELK